MNIRIVRLRDYDRLFSRQLCVCRSPPSRCKHAFEIVYFVGLYCLSLDRFLGLNNDVSRLKLIGTMVEISRELSSYLGTNLVQTKVDTVD
jgi:hypothetical protein